MDCFLVASKSCILTQEQLIIRRRVWLIANRLNHASYPGNIVRTIFSSFEMHIPLLSENPSLLRRWLLRRDRNRTLIMKGTYTGCFCIMSSLSNLHCCILLAFFDSFVVDPILGNLFMQTMERDKSFVCPLLREWGSFSSVI